MAELGIPILALGSLYLACKKNKRKILQAVNYQM